MVAISLINLLVGSSAIQTIVSLIGVVVFTELTAWDTQRARSEHVAYARTEQPETLAVIGALSLYLNFVNRVQLLLNLGGEQDG